MRSVGVLGRRGVGTAKNEAGSAVLRRGTTRRVDSEPILTFDQKKMSFGVLTSAAAAYFVSSSDGSRFLACSLCAIHPMSVAVDLLQRDKTEAEDVEGALKLVWIVFGLSFVINFIAAMVCVRNNVSIRDLEHLLQDSMSLLCTGVTSALALLNKQNRETIIVEQSLALLFYIMLASGFNLSLCLSVLTLVSVIILGNLQAFTLLGAGKLLAVTCISIILAVRLEEIFWC